MCCVFSENYVILAHCLTKNGGAGNEFSLGKTLYERLDYVFHSKPHVSCSTIRVGDSISNNNFFGPVGLILKNARILCASPSDMGTFVKNEGTREFDLDEHNSPNTVNIRAAISQRSNSGYNEFVAADYDIFGIFLCADEMSFLKYHIGDEETLYNSTVEYNVPYFWLLKGELSKINYQSGYFIKVSDFEISNIYK